MLVKNVAPPGITVTSTVPGPGADSCAYTRSTPPTSNTAMSAAAERNMTASLMTGRNGRRHLIGHVVCRRLKLQKLLGKAGVRPCGAPLDAVPRLRTMRIHTHSASDAVETAHRRAHGPAFAFHMRVTIGRSRRREDRMSIWFSDPNRSGNHRGVHCGHQTRQHVKRDGTALPSVMAMSHRTIERVIGRLLTDEELRLKFTRSPGERSRS